MPSASQLCSHIVGEACTGQHWEVEDAPLARRSSACHGPNLAFYALSWQALQQHVWKLGVQQDIVVLDSGKEGYDLQHTCVLTYQGISRSS